MRLVYFMVQADERFFVAKDCHEYRAAVPLTQCEGEMCRFRSYYEARRFFALLCDCADERCANRYPRIVKVTVETVTVTQRRVR